MRNARSKRNFHKDYLDYLCVDDYLSNIIATRALATAFELGIIDDILHNQPRSLTDVQRKFNLKANSVEALIEILISIGVTEASAGGIRLTSKFLNALQYRDLLETKLKFIMYVAPDFTEYFTTLVVNPELFMQRSRIFDLFSYSRCFDYTKENFIHTRKWMRITTVLTKYESQACIAHHDFSRYRRILDIGGNSGEFVFQISLQHPDIKFSVFDLPVVCEVGKEYIREQGASDKISFIKGNALLDELPNGYDLVMFKSMLHDWPDKETNELLRRAQNALVQDGTVLIYERGPFDFKWPSLPVSVIPFLLFFNFYRSSEAYQEKLSQIGFYDINIQNIKLEMPFHLISAKKK